MDLSPSPSSEVSVESMRLTDAFPALTSTSSGRERSQLVSRASEFLSRHAAEGVRISELARAAGVSERTLRNAFHAEHGLSPKKFDLRERLCGARRALCNAESSHKTVTSVACEFGFYELGRFALTYKKMFGESPSETFRAHHAAVRNTC
jgi:AraC family ethanolamine operon transcriptional activator